MSCVRLYHTLRYLRWVQIVFRLLRAVPRRKPRALPRLELREMRGEWVTPAATAPSMTAADRVRLLNVERELAFPQIWQDDTQGLLWSYNLHYFEDLCAQDAQTRRTWHLALIEQWLRDNPPATGIGWQPYPTSLRIANWVKAHWSGLQLPAAAIESIAVQARWLLANLEYHLLANHLLANAKALIMAGCLLRGHEADHWMTQGLHILEREIGEQILADGGHYERSAMYHQQVLLDLLDLVNALRHCGIRPTPMIEQAVGRMRTWLACMCHPDGDICLFNDAAFGVMPSPATLEDYAARLKLGAAEQPCSRVHYLSDTGYARLANDTAVAFLDIAPIAPAYQPAHAHADTLTFELSVYGARVVVDTGTSIYTPGAERHRQRSTRAHNTVVIDQQDSSQVWSSFRVGRRADIEDVLVDVENATVSAGHNGYRHLRGHPVHHREWRMTPGKLTVSDVVKGAGEHRLELRFHLHPRLRVVAIRNDTFSLHTPDGRDLRIHVAPDLDWQIVATTYHPEFGKIIASECLQGSVNTGLPWSTSTAFVWDDG